MNSVTSVCWQCFLKTFLPYLGKKSLSCLETILSLDKALLILDRVNKMAGPVLLSWACYSGANLVGYIWISNKQILEKVLKGHNSLCCGTNILQRIVFETLS